MCSQDEDADILDCPLKHRYNVVGIGPGLGNYPEGEAMLQKLLEQYRDPMVIDADAINMLGIYRNLLPLLPARSILTPHAGELHRLICYCETSYERLRKPLSAERHSVYLILKGAYSACCMPDEMLYSTATGNGNGYSRCGDVLRDPCRPIGPRLYLCRSLHLGDVSAWLWLPTATWLRKARKLFWLPILLHLWDGFPKSPKLKGPAIRPHKFLPNSVFSEIRRERLLSVELCPATPQEETKLHVLSK